MKVLFDKKMYATELMGKINKDRIALEEELRELIKKAKSFELSASKQNVDEHMAEVEKTFKDVEEKKKYFEKELKQLSLLFK